MPLLMCLDFDQPTESSSIHSSAILHRRRKQACNVCRVHGLEVLLQCLVCVLRELHDVLDGVNWRLNHFSSPSSSGHSQFTPEETAGEPNEAVLVANECTIACGLCAGRLEDGRWVHRIDESGGCFLEQLVLAIYARPCVVEALFVFFLWAMQRS